MTSMSHLPGAAAAPLTPAAASVRTQAYCCQNLHFSFFSREAGNQDIYGKSPNFRVLVIDVLFKTNKTALWPTTTWAPNCSQRCGQHASISLNRRLPFGRPLTLLTHVAFCIMKS